MTTKQAKTLLTCDLRDLWVAKLRSGDYSQGRAALLKCGAYCCLGVLCEAAGIEKRPVYGFSHLFAFHVPNTGQDYEWTSVQYPKNIAGLDEDWCRRLARMNDGGYSFSQIADVILKEVPCDPVPTPEGEAP